MDARFRPARLKSAGAVLLDIMMAASVLAVLVVAILTLLSDNARGELARAYARQMRLSSEDQCPSQWGNDFWFKCASEVHRLQASPTAPAALPSRPSGQTSVLRAPSRDR